MSYMYYQHICTWVDLSLLFDNESQIGQQKFDFDSGVKLA